MLCRFWFLLCLLCCTLGASEKPKVCLNMIVKNEKSVIERCLKSVKPFIDYWVIVDTGSTDGTQDVIRNFMKDIPGELHESPWKNFEHNRNEALELAKPHGDFVMMIDADEYLVYDKSFHLPELTHNVYCIKCHSEGTAFTRISIAKVTPELQWKGIIHEYLTDPAFETYAIIAGIDNISTSEGARSKDPAKLLRDAIVLEKILKKEPDNSRYRFYLAQTYKAHGDKVLALENYQKRARQGGSEDELYETKLQIVLLSRDLGMKEERYRDELLKLFKSRPSRVEPLYYLSVFYRSKKDYQLAYFFARLGLSAPPTTDVINVPEWVTQWGLLFELSVAAYWVGEYEMSAQAAKDLLKVANVPKEYREQTIANLAFAEEKLTKAKN